MNAAPVVLCLGEPLVVLSPQTGRSLEASAELSVSIGGAEANVAVHLARLGVEVRYAGRIGNDPFGRRIRHALASEGVDVSALELDPSHPTGLYAKDPAPAGTVAYYYRRGSAASAMAQLLDGALDDVGLVHVSGVFAALSSGCLALVGELLRGPAPVSFDVNYRPVLWKRADDSTGPDVDPGVVLAELARRASIVFVGLDEAELLWGCRSAADVRTLLPNVELVVKDSEHPATAFRGDVRVDVAALPVPVVEPVGAGDAFAAGYLSVRRSGGGASADLARAVRTGHAVAAGVLSVGGDQGEGTDAALLHAATTGRGWPDGAS